MSHDNDQDSTNGNGNILKLLGRGVVTVALLGVANLYHELNQIDKDVTAIKAVLPEKTADRYTGKDAARDKAELLHRIEELERRVNR